MLKKNYIYSSTERCLYCNEIIPEGRMICPICEEKLMSFNQGKNAVKHSASKLFMQKIFNRLS